MSLDRLGRVRFAVLVILMPLSLFYLVAGAYALSGLDPLHLLNAPAAHNDDFATFWSASRLALSGTPELVYDIDVMRALEREVAGPASAFTPWHYPPTFLLAVLPLAFLPVPVALLLWLLAPLAALMWIMRRLYDSKGYAWALLLFPGTAICLVSAQNGFLTASLAGAALLALDRRPILAGVFCGLLTWKPHLAAVVFIALLAGGHWRALASAATTAILLAALSMIVFGLGPWRAFAENLSYVTGLLESGALPSARMPSVYVSARLLGADIIAARILQAVASLAAVATVGALWHHGAPLRWRGAALAAALPLVTPYVFDYDLVLMAFAVFWLLDACLREGWQPGDTVLLVAAWIGPALSWPLLKLGFPPFLPLVFALLLAVIWRRAISCAAVAPVPSAGAV